MTAVGGEGRPTVDGVMGNPKSVRMLQRGQMCWLNRPKRDRVWPGLVGKSGAHGRLFQISLL